MRVRVVTDTGEEIEEPFLLRLTGWTEARYFEEAPEDRLWEFQEGEVIVHSPATPQHQRLVGFLTFLLKGYVEAKGLGEVFNGPAVLRLRPGWVKEPDLFFIRRERLSGVQEKWVEGPADLVIEVSSPGTRRYDLEEKAGVYAESGVLEYGVIDPERREVVIHRVDHPGYRVGAMGEGRLASTAVPGFWIEVGWLWQHPLPPALRCLRQILGER
ncbi:Uma2 family endonuclease [Thermoflexus sp.]|uniref:Uma2 family endonuclease n=1 Tax=Thermoflexus sp. TaxID=1969742 RepID=UPI002ADE2C48|nr:Uma2 family endonuclease [Thermoflexus sp.]